MNTVVQEVDNVWVGTNGKMIWFRESHLSDKNKGVAKVGHPVCG